MFDRKTITEALVYGNEKGYELFPEIRNKKLINNLNSGALGRDMLEQIRADAETAAAEPSPEITFSMFKAFEESGNRLIFENAYFRRRKQLFLLILDYVLEGKKSYKTLIEEKLWQWCELYSWELPAHFSMSSENIRNGGEEPDKVVALFAAESAFFFAEILSVIGKELDEFLVFRLKKEIFRRVINPYKGSSYWWEDARMNWSSVCAGSVGAAALYLIDDVEELSLILERVIKSMDAFIDAFDEEGLITEGLSYWSYGFSFFVYFSELLKERTAGKLSLLEGSDKIRKIAELPQKLQFPSEDFVNFSDSGNGKWTGDCGLFARLEKVLGIKGYSYSNSSNICRDHTYKWVSMARKLLWSADLKASSDSSVKVGKFFFEESQWLVDRRIVRGKFTAFAAKGGHNDEPHNHNDLGNFILHYGGENILVDIGSPEYVKEYFRDETRYNFLTASSYGHSVPVINNNTQSFGREYEAKVIKQEEKGSKTSFILDLKKAYSCQELEGFERGFSWDYENLELEIKDKFSFNESNNEISEAFITRVKPEISGDRTILVKSGSIEAELKYPEGVKYLIEECSYNNHNGEKSYVYRTAFTGSADREKEYIFKIKLNFQE